MPAVLSDAIPISPDSRLVFLHVPKTAGTTLWLILQRQYTPTAVFRTEDYAVAPTLTPQKWDNTRVLLGHFGFGIKVGWPEPPACITVLRDPQERLLSHYAHISRDPKHPLARKILTETGAPLTMNTYLDSKWWEVDNGQTRMLAGPEAMALPFGDCDQAVFEMAKQNMMENIALTGLTERFDEMLLLLQGMFGWKLPCYTSENIGEGRPRCETVPPEIFQRVSELTRWDRELYALAEARFDERIAEAGPSFTAALSQFRHANARYAKLRSLVVASPLRSLKSLLPLERQMRLETVVRSILGRTH